MYRAQKYFVFLLMMPLATSAMEPAPQKSICDEQEWSEHTLNITKDAESGEKTYVGTYPVDVPQGFVKVKTNFLSLWRKVDPKDVHITVDRHAKQQIIVTAVLTKKIAEESDRVEQRDISHIQYGWLWKPWWIDVVSHPQDLFRAVSRIKLRGNNRLCVEIREPGHYHIMVPEDADIEVKNKVGGIDYKSKVPTTMNIVCETANSYGGQGGGGMYDFNWGNHNLPKTVKTRLIAKNGHINVPDRPRF